MKLNDENFCLTCSAGFHYECINFDSDLEACCCPDEQSQLLIPTTGGEKNRYKSDEEVTDPKSTGRKRAADLYPINKDNPAPCEWQGLKFAGGGLYPIIGCINGVTLARHHGPDKDTLNNSLGNVHRICAHCHNRWHTLNDGVYKEAFGTSDWKEHDPNTRAAPEEIIANEAKWATKKKQTKIKGDTD